MDNAHAYIKHLGNYFLKILQSFLLFTGRLPETTPRVTVSSRTTVSFPVAAAPLYAIIQPYNPVFLCDECKGNGSIFIINNTL
jgi:hypothetical protein